MEDAGVNKVDINIVGKKKVISLRRSNVLFRCDAANKLHPKVSRPNRGGGGKLLSTNKTHQ